MSTATWRDSRRDHNRAARAREVANHWWAGKSLADALRLLWDAARDRGGLAASDVRGVLLTFSPEAVECALRRARDRGHLIECRRHTPEGGVTSVFHCMGTRP